MKIIRNQLIEKDILLAIPTLFIIATPLHFLYNFTGCNIIVGSFVPVNESIAEHFKLVTFPMILWWSISYYYLKKKVEIDFKKWIIAMVMATITAPIVIASFYYTYTGALGIESFVLDIFSLLLAITISQNIGLHFYKYCRNQSRWIYIALVLLFLIAVFTIAFTFYPLHIPLFRDGATGIYGI